MRYKGFFRPRKISKYKGDHRKIVYRSKLELTFMKYCDDNDAILEWSSEEIIIPYRSPVDGKLHRYFPDFWVRTPNGQTLIEIKPKRQCKPPTKNPKMKKDPDSESERENRGTQNIGSKILVKATCLKNISASHLKNISVGRAQKIFSCRFFSKQ